MILAFAWLVMLAQIRRSSMLRKPKLVFSLIFCCCLSVAHSQDSQENTTDQVSGELSQQETQASDQAVGEEGDAENPAQKQQQIEVEEQQEKKAQENKKEDGKPKPPKDVFKPSEEISEDLPVPFPVDI